MRRIFRAFLRFLRAGALPLGAAAALGVGFLFTSGYHWLTARLFAAWGVTSANLSLAPGWVQFVVQNAAILGAMLLNGAIALLALGLLRLQTCERPKWGRGLPSGLALGALIAALALLLFRLIDAMRFGYALYRPQFSASTPLLFAYCALAALGAELLSRGFALRALLRSNRRALAYLVSVLFQVILYGLTEQVSAISLLNCALWGLLAALLYERTGGVACAWGLQFALQALTAGVLGMPPRAPGALFELYSGASNWLTGGDAGLNAGIYLTLVFSALIAWYVWTGRRPAKAEAGAKKAGR